MCQLTWVFPRSGSRLTQLIAYSKCIAEPEPSSSTATLNASRNTLTFGKITSHSDRRLAREAIFEVIQNLVRDQNPPETKQTHERLIAEGHSHDETMKLIGCVLTSEMSEIL